MTVSTSGGQMMRSARKERNVSQRHLADSVGVNFTYISKIENGAMPPPSDATISAIATTLELDSDDLFVGFGKIPPDIIAALKGDAELTRRVRLLMNSEPTPHRPQPRTGTALAVATNRRRTMITECVALDNAPLFQLVTEPDDPGIHEPSQGEVCVETLDEINRLTGERWQVVHNPEWTTCFVWTNDNPNDPLTLLGNPVPASALKLMLYGVLYTLQRGTQPRLEGIEG